ncbi:uncharacterized protein LOC111371046 [Olea europaea var. sylvestris]|uniref:uncharacterized protein LOC111371046 n=1 Tax=Olea europaea var. sylvestris TaxID=158386 RepID=UPI000C1D5B37|nr:uncharacterized protein LOC111371046 [Olea europaea var. sylvestris]
MFVSRAAGRCFPFFKLLRENQSFNWNKECNLAFQELKQTLSTPPVLTKPEPGETLLLYLVVSQNAVSGVMVKEKRRVQQPVYYISKVFLNAETRYTIALALVIAARKLRSYFQSQPIVVLTNQPLRHILQKPDVLGRLLKWVIELGKFDIEFKPRPAIKAQALVDFIAELSPKNSATQDNNPSTTLKIWERFEFEATNNEVEYEAVIITSELAKSLELEHVKVFSVSRLVVRQIEGSFERKDEKVARADNVKADALSRLAFKGVDGLDKSVYIKRIAEPSIAQKPSVMDIDHEPSWTDPIVDYISNGSLPADPRLARSIRYRAASYCLIEGVLFRRSFTLSYLRCLKPFESLQALTEVHEGICRNHQGGRALTYKLIRYGYYWPSLKKDAQDYVRNGLVEVTNRIILQDLRTRIGDAKGDWPDELPSILWAYRTSHKTATSETPFMLAFRLKANIPIEVSLPTMRKLEINRERQTIEHLDLLEEVREQASLRAASYQYRMAKHFNNKVQTRRFRAGDIVLRKAEAAGHQPGKLGLTWEGPFEVTRKLKVVGAYSLRDTSGKPFPRPWNADNLKIYYK